MTRMLGTWSRPWCPHCHAPAGEDCPSRSWSKKTQRAREKRAWQRKARAVSGMRSNDHTHPGVPDDEFA